MSFHVFFAFSEGLAHDLLVPRGTKEKIFNHISKVEAALGLKHRTIGGAGICWDTSDANYKNGFPSMKRAELCCLVEEHNAWVRRLYDDMAKWSEKPVIDGEVLMPEEAAKFWHGLQMIAIPTHRWSADYYRARMETLYEVMRGRESDGINFGAKALTPRQAAAVIRIFEEHFPNHDLRLDVPDGRDYLASSSDGGYDWCDKCCKPKSPYDHGCAKKKCPLVSNL